MTLANIGHHTIIGTYHFAEPVHFTKITDTHFNNRRVVFLPDTQKGKGYSDFIVEISLIL